MSALKTLTRYEVQIQRSPKPKSTYRVHYETSNRRDAIASAKKLQRHNPSYNVRIHVVTYVETQRTINYAHRSY